MSDNDDAIKRFHERCDKAEEQLKALMGEERFNAMLKEWDDRMLYGPSMKPCEKGKEPIGLRRWYEKEAS